MAALQRRPGNNEAAASREVADMVKKVAQRLGNTPAVCRKCYIHPAILDAYLEGELPPRHSHLAGPRELNANEKRLLEFLRERTSTAR